MCPIVPPEGSGEYEGPAFEPGIYLAEVQDCRQEISKTSGAEMFTVRWTAVGFGAALLARDYISFSEKAAGITAAKLVALGFDSGDDVKAHELLGKRAYLQIVHEDYKGRMQCKVQTSFESGCRAGYWPEDGFPEEELGAWLVKPGAVPVSTKPPPEDDGIPF